jgi:MFS family permease
LTAPGDDVSRPDMVSSAARGDTPTRSGLTRLLALLLPTALALYANFQGVQLILVPLQVETLDPNRKIVDLALMTVLCAATGVLGLMTGGAASDATRSRWGRRTPWLVGMASASAVISAALGLQRSLFAMALLYGALWFTLNCFQGALLAIAPDRVPEERRSLASSTVGVAGPLGALFGVNLAALAPGEWGYVGLTTALAAATAALVIFAPENPYPSTNERGSGEAAAFHGLRPRAAMLSLQSFGARDFSLAFALRVTMFVAQFSINNYLLYILQDHIGAATLPAHSAQIAAGALNALRTTATIVAILAAGWLANRTERRKIFVRTYALAMAAAMLVPAFSPTWFGMLIFATVGGLAMGVYGAIDLALMSHVLPNKEAAGRDLAILVMAGAVAQFLAPVVGGGFIKFLGYGWLFIFAALATLAVGATTFFLRKVR